MLVVRCIEVHEVREETARRYLACKFVQVVVPVFRKVADASLLLPDLDREDGCRSVSDTFVSGVKNLSDNASSFRRGVGSVVDRAEYHLITTT